MWCFPGGGCDENEEYIDTLIREVKEEYDLSINKEDCKLFMTQTNLNPFVGKMFFARQIFICNVDFTQIPVLHEGADMQWMNIDQIKKMKLGFHQSYIVPKLEKYLKSIK